MVEEKKPFGYIYTRTIPENGKVYVGKVEREKYERKGIEPLQGRWDNHVKKAEILQRKREANPDKKFKGNHMLNAIIKYGRDAFDSKIIDTAYSLKELNDKERHWVKEYDSMNPDKGYNMTEGGDFGRLRPEILQDPVYREKQKAGTRKALNELYKDPKVRENHRVRTSKAIKKKWKGPKYREKQDKAKEKIGAATKERFKNPEFRKKHSEATKKAMEKVVKNPKYIENMSIASKKMWQNPEYREKHHKAMEKVFKNPEYIKKQIETHTTPEAIEKQSRMGKERFKDPEFKEKHRNATSQGMKAKWKDPEYIEKQKIAKKELGKSKRKEIENKRDFLNDVKSKTLKKELLVKYGMRHNALTRRIQEMLGPDGPKNYRELKNYLQDKNIDDILKEIEERNDKKEISPEIQGDDSKDKEESTSQSNLKEKTDNDTKSDEKDGLEEQSKEENEDHKSNKDTENSERSLNQETVDENLGEKEEKSTEIEKKIESIKKDEIDEESPKKEEESNVSDSEENISKYSSNSEEKAKYGKNVEDMENLNMSVKDYAGIDKNSSEREQDISCLDENQGSKNSESIKYIDIEDIESIVIVKDIKADEEKDYMGVDEGAKKEVPDYTFIDNFLDNIKGIKEKKSDKRNERGRDYRYT